MRANSLLLRVVAGHPRLFLAALAGALSLLVPVSASGVTRGIVAWDVAITVFIALSAQLFTAQPAGRMPENAARQEEGEWTIFAITMGAVSASFAAIIFEFSSSKDMPAAARGLHVALVAFTLLASWLMTHTVFALRYAHEYYGVSSGRSAVDGGLEFPGETAPDYWDFFYFALVLGMTFQVSDVQITSRKLRRLASVHGLLGFLFNTVIIALTVNIGASLL